MLQLCNKQLFVFRTRRSSIQLSVMNSRLCSV